MLDREPFPGQAGVSLEGPWEGDPEALGLPPTAKSLLKTAKECGWGFGPITLVMRLNHEYPGIPPFYMSWEYSIESAKWSFMGGRDKTGHKLTVPAVRTMLPLAKEVPNE